MSQLRDVNNCASLDERQSNSESQKTKNPLQVPSSSSITACSEPWLPELVKTRLDQYVQHFVTQFEAKLAAYRSILLGEATKSGKFAEAISDVASEGDLFKLLGIVPFAGLLGKQAKKAIEKIGSELHLKIVTERKDLVDSSRADKSEFRRKLVEAGVDVFQSFEMQFMRVTTVQGVEKALKLLAKDAVDRAVSKWVEEDNVSISVRIIYGKSKRANTYNASPGFDITYKNQSSEVKWTTTNLYEKVGVVKEAGSTSEYFRKKDGDSDTGVYGYRRLLVGEKLSESYGSDNIAESKSRMFTGYTYNIDTKNLNKLVDNLFEIINSKDVSLTEDRVKKVLEEVKAEILNKIESIEINSQEMGKEIGEQITLLKEYMISLKVEDYMNQFKQYFIKYTNQCQDSINELKTQSNVIQATINALTQKVDELSLVSKKDQENLSIWYNVKEPTLHFTGRTRELDDLHSKIHHENRTNVICQVTAICGLGGIGKTELARQYVRINGKHFDNNVLWINAENQTILSSSFSKLASNELGWKVGKESDIGKVVKDIYTFFTHRKCLFIFDNAENIDSIKAFLPVSLTPDSNKPYILVTSRNQNWEIGTRKVNLNELELTEAVDLVKIGLSVTDGCQDEQITRLANVMQRFPLALQQAVAYIREEQQKAECTGNGKYELANYLEQYEQKKEELLDSNVFRSFDNDYSKTTLTTWRMTINKIQHTQGEGPLALKIFELIAFLDPNNIPVKTIFSSISKNANALWQSVILLKKYSMIKLSGGMLDVHRLVQEATRINLEQQERHFSVIEEAFNMLDSSFPYESDKLEDIPLKRQLLPHLEAFISCLDDFLKRAHGHEEEIEEYLETLLPQMADAYQDFGNPEKVIKLLQKALEIEKKRYGEDSTEVADTLTNLANAYDDLGEPHKVIQLLERALEIQKDPLEKAEIQNNLANAYSDLGDFSTMKMLLEKVLDIEEKHYKKDNVEIAKTISNLAHACQGSGDKLRAKELLERALTIEEQHYEPNHIEVIRTRINLARADDSLDVTEKIDILEDALKRFQEYYDQDNFAVGMVLSHLGDAYGESCSFVKQTELLERALAILEKHYGEENIKLVGILKSLGNAYGNLGDSESATKFLKRASDIQKARDLEQPGCSYLVNLIGPVNPL